MSRILRGAYTRSTLATTNGAADAFWLLFALAEAGKLLFYLDQMDVTAMQLFTGADAAKQHLLDKRHHNYSGEDDSD